MKRDHFMRGKDKESLRKIYSWLALEKNYGRICSCGRAIRRCGSVLFCLKKNQGRKSNEKDISYTGQKFRNIREKED